MCQFDWFRHFDYQYGLIGRIPWHLDTFGPIQKFRISAEDLSQLFCRIHRKLKVLIFANESVDSMGLSILIINLDLLDKFHGIKMHLAQFKIFVFLQKSSVRSFAGLTEN